MPRFNIVYNPMGLQPEMLDIVRQIEELLGTISPMGVTSTDLQNASHYINNLKQHGMMVTTSDTNVTVWASGNAATAAWVNASGVSVYVPL